VRKVSIVIIFGEDTNYEALHYAITSSLLGPNIFLSTLFSNTLNLYSPLNVVDQVSYPHKIEVLCFNLYSFRQLVRKQNIVNGMGASINLPLVSS
jgi:hypothetical protein